MKSTYTLPLVTCLSLSLFAACQSAPLGQTARPENTTATNAQTVSQQISATTPEPAFSSISQSLAEPVPAMVKTPASGDVRYDGQTLTVQLQLPPISPSAEQLPFQTQLLDLTTAVKITATVKDSYGKSYSPVGADGNGQITYPANGIITLTFNNVRPDELLLVEAQVTETSPSTLIPQADLAVALRHTAISNVTTGTMDFQSTAVAKTLKELLALNAARARAISLPDLNSLMQTITGRTGSAPNYSYAQNHPSLVKTSQLATALQAQEPANLTGSASSYRGLGATVNLTVSGLLASDKLQVQLTDAATAVKTNLGNGSGAGFSFTRVTPGSGLKLKILAFGTPSQTYTYSFSPTTLPALTEGGSQTVTITAAPNLTFSNFSPAIGAPGTLVTITGSGFDASTVVKFNGVTATSTFVSATQINATVPATATDGVITLTNGASGVTSATSFDVLRTLYVKTNATGSNTGTSWADAYTSLPTALGAATTGDEVWVAAGTYKPHASNPATSFNLPAGIGFYGGFAGTETLRSQRNPWLNTTRLSGDLNGDDTYGSMPFGNRADNTQVFFTGSRDVVVDGFTIEGGVGTTSRPSIPCLALRQTIVTHNSSLASLTLDGPYSCSAYATATIENSYFIANYTTVSQGGGALVARNGGQITVNNSVFYNNVALNGPGDALVASTGAEYFLKNVTFVNNDIDFSATSPSASIFTNVLLSNSGGFGGVTQGADSKIAGSDPFVNLAVPMGSDGRWGTADDGLRLSGTDASLINAGTPTGAPLLDILGTARVNNPEPGAYEFIPGPAPTLSGFTPNNATAGTLVTITGTNLSTTSAVRFNGVDAASFTIISNTQITATVPTGATDGTISVVTPSGTASSSGSFDVQRRIHVKSNAAGSNTGTSWTHAYTSLQTALSSAGENDEIWVAAGTYKPHTSDTNATFDIPINNLAIYGGFAGNESTLAARNITTNVTILSGDLQNDDNTAVTPFTSATPNSSIVLQMTGKLNNRLDGITIQGAQQIGMFLSNDSNLQLSNLTVKHNKGTVGAGMQIGNGTSFTAENLNVHHNAASIRGGGIQLFQASGTLNNSLLEFNQADFGAGINIWTDAALTLTNSQLNQNTATTSGAGIHVANGSAGNTNQGHLTFSNIIMKNNSSPNASGIRVDDVKGTFTLSRAAFIGNTGGDVLSLNVYNMQQIPTRLSLANLLVANNTSPNAQHISIDGENASYVQGVALRNITMANNTCTAGAGSRCTILNTFTSKSTYQNLLLWKDLLGGAPATGGGNVDLGTGGTPFVSFSDPDGADNLWFTADDGYNLRSTATTAINTGITGAAIPLQDIVQRNRIGNPEPGAYEFGY